MSISPFVKWAGGKRVLAFEIGSYLPMKYVSRYVEPFVGGGAVFCYLHNNGRLAGKASLLADSNRTLMNVWSSARDKNTELVAAVRAVDLDAEAARDKREFFLRCRQIYNEFRDQDEIVVAAHFLWLNANCFNGLYRENSKGEVNTPWGKYDPPRRPNTSNLILLERALANTDLVCADFESVLDRCGEGDAVYCDPPYAQTTNTSFTKYSQVDFTEQDHRRLHAAVCRAHKRGAHVVVSNSQTALSSSLYSSDTFVVREVVAHRQIGRDPSSRGGVLEMLVTTKWTKPTTPKD